jgi:hypothetical protein
MLLPWPVNVTPEDRHHPPPELACKWDCRLAARAARSSHLVTYALRRSVLPLEHGDEDDGLDEAHAEDDKVLERAHDDDDKVLARNVVVLRMMKIWFRNSMVLRMMSISMQLHDKAADTTTPVPKEANATSRYCRSQYPHRGAQDLVRPRPPPQAPPPPMHLGTPSARRPPGDGSGSCLGHPAAGAGAGAGAAGAAGVVLMPTLVAELSCPRGCPTARLWT